MWSGGALILILPERAMGSTNWIKIIGCVCSRFVMCGGGRVFVIYSNFAHNFLVASKQTNKKSKQNIMKLATHI